MEISNQIQVEQQVRQLNDEWVKALVRGDGETLNRIMADDFILTYPLEGDDKADFIGGGSPKEPQKKNNPREKIKKPRLFPHPHSYGAPAATAAPSVPAAVRGLYKNHRH